MSTQSTLIARVITDGVKKATDEFKRFNTTTAISDKSMTSMLKTSGKLATAAIAAGGAVAAFTLKMVDNIDTMNDMANKAGITFDEFQKLSGVFSTVGLSTEATSGLMLKAERAMTDLNTKGTGPLAKVLKTLGTNVDITKESFKGLSGLDGMAKLQSAMEKANIPMAQQSVLMEKAFKGSSAILPLLRDQADALNELGDAYDKANSKTQLTAQNVMDAGKLADEWDLFKVAMTNAGMKFSAEVAPMIIDALHNIAGAASTTLDFFQSVGEWIDARTGDIASSTGGLVQQLDLINGSIKDLEAINSGKKDTFLQELIDTAKNAGAQIEILISERNKLGSQNEAIASAKKASDADSINAEINKLAIMKNQVEESKIKLRFETRNAETAKQVWDQKRKELEADRIDRAKASAANILGDFNGVNAKADLTLKYVSEISDKTNTTSAAIVKQNTLYDDQLKTISKTVLELEARKQALENPIIEATKPQKDSGLEDLSADFIKAEEKRMDEMIKSVQRDQRYKEQSDAIDIERAQDKRNILSSINSMYQESESQKLDIWNAEMLEKINYAANQEYLTEAEKAKKLIDLDTETARRREEIEADRIAKYVNGTASMLSATSGAFDAYYARQSEAREKAGKDDTSGMVKQWRLARTFAIASATLSAYAAGAQAFASPSAVTPEGKFAAYAVTIAGALNVVSQAMAVQWTPPRAQGGMFGKGTYLVGEKGPEMVQFGSGGRIANNQDTNRLMNGGGNGMAPITIINNTTGRIDKVEQKQMDDGRIMLIMKEYMNNEVLQPNSNFNKNLDRTRNVQRKI